MRETVGSLKAYFILISLSALASSVWAIANLDASPITLFSLLISLVLGGAYLYVGIKLRPLLRESPELVSRLIWASMVSIIVNFLLAFLFKLPVSSLPHLVLGLVITIYLLVNVKRLAQEEKEKLHL